MIFFSKLIRNKAFVCRNIPVVVMFFVLFTIGLLQPLIVKSQSEGILTDSIPDKTTDTTKVKHYPKLAALMSAVIPGLGQAYNKKYWKIPIIYVGFGALGYFENRSSNRYKLFKNGYSELLRLNKPDSTIVINGVGYNMNALSEGRNYYRRYRDLYVIFIAGLYLINIVDASVDAHLFDFDISDDISMQVSPSVGDYCMARPVTGLSIKIHFK